MIYHITSKQTWESARPRGEYTAPSLQTEGFIHCSAEKQVVAVANAFYRGRNDLVLLQLDESRIKSQVKWEAPAGPSSENIADADLFPHIYGPINLDAVASVLDFPPDSESGTFNLPPITGN